MQRRAAGSSEHYYLLGGRIYLTRSYHSSKLPKPTARGPRWATAPAPRAWRCVQEFLPMGSQKSKRRKPAVRLSRRPPFESTTLTLSSSSVSSLAAPTSTTGVGDVTGGSAPLPAPDAGEGVADHASAAAGSPPPPPPVAGGCTPSSTHSDGSAQARASILSPPLPVAEVPLARAHLAGRRPPAAPGSFGPPRPPSGVPHSVPPGCGGLWAAMSPLGSSASRSDSQSIS